MNKKLITLITIIVFTLAQLQGCSTTGPKHNTYSSQYEDEDFNIENNSNDTSSVLLIGASVIAVVGLSVLAGILLIHAAAKGLGQSIGGHIA